MFFGDEFFRFAALLLRGAVVLILVAGCGEPPAAGPTGTVSGRAILDENPLPEGCVVMFVSDRTTAIGIVQSDGRYEMKSPAGSEQISVGDYQVAVRPPAPRQLSAEEDEEFLKGQAVPPSGEYEDLIPERYRSTGASGLLFEVREGDNTFPIELVTP